MATAPATKALPTANPANPFPGLRPFREDESGLFFGQEDHVEDLLDRLGRKRFVAVLGQSGSGKSSLMRAGLLPELRKGKLADNSPRWVVVETHPGENPVGRLAARLAAAFAGCGVDVAGEITRDSRALLRIVAEAHLPPRQKVLIFVDQFEELFRYCRQSTDSQQRDQADHFVKLLLEAVNDPGSPIYIVLAMRSEFLGDCALFFDLAEQVNEGTFLLPRMTRDQAERVIAGPVEARGAHIDRRLLQRLLNDSEGLEDGLPLLQHALRRVWEHWRERGQPDAEIGLADYELPEEKCKAWPSPLQAHLNVHLNSIYEGLGEGRERVARELFRLLSERDNKGRDVRRPVRYQDLLNSLPAALHPDIEPVIDAFRDASQGRTFLMPPQGQPLAGSMVDISHECLLRRWDRLRKWIGWEEEDRRHFELLADTADRAGWRGEAQSGAVRPLDIYQLKMLQEWWKKSERTAAWGQRYQGEADPELGRPRRSFAPAVEYLAWSQERQRKEEEDERKAEADRVKQEAEYRRMEAENRATAAQLDLQRRRELSRVFWAVGLVALLGLGLWGVDSWRKKDEAIEARNASDLLRRKAEAEEANARNAEEVAVQYADQVKRTNTELEKQRAMLAVKTREAERSAQVANEWAVDADKARRDADRLRETAVLALHETTAARDSLAREKAKVDQTNSELERERDRLAEANRQLELGRQRDEFRQAGSNTRKQILAAASAGAPAERVTKAHPVLDTYLAAAKKRPAEEAVNEDVRSVFEQGLGAISSALQSGRMAGKPNIGPGTRAAVTVSTTGKDGKAVDQVVGLLATNHLRVQIQPVKGDATTDVTGSQPHDVDTGRLSGVSWALPLLELNRRLLSHDIAPGGTHIAVGTAGGRVTVLERTADPKQPYRRVMSKRPRWSPAELVRFSRDGRLIVTAAEKGGWTLFDLDRRKETAKNETTGHRLAQAAISENGRWLAYTTRRGGVVLESFAQRGAERLKSEIFVPEEKDDARPDTDQPVEVSNDGTVMTVNEKTELEIHAVLQGQHRILRGGTHVDAAALDANAGDENWLALAAHGGHISIFDWKAIRQALRSGETKLPDAHAELEEPVQTRHSDVRRLSWSGQTLSTLDQYGFVTVWKPFEAPKQLDLITRLRLTLSATLKKPTLVLDDIAQVMKDIAAVVSELTLQPPAAKLD